ncbi:MAG: PIN domain-containing protein [bacterium]|nr:PIN domain-containing protein [bacterium]
MNKYIALDTMLFIYYLEGNERFGTQAQEIFKNIENESKGITSIITISEVLSLPIFKENEFLLEQTKHTLKSIKNVEFLPLTEEIAEKAAYIKRKYVVRLPDAIQLATAWSKNATEFITNDKKLKRITEVSIKLLS